MKIGIPFLLQDLLRFRSCFSYQYRHALRYFCLDGDFSERREKQRREKKNNTAFSFHRYFFLIHNCTNPFLKRSA